MLKKGDKLKNPEKSRLVLEDKVRVLIPRLFKFFSLKFEKELFGKIMCLLGCLELLEGVVMAV